MFDFDKTITSLLISHYKNANLFLNVFLNKLYQNPASSFVPIQIAELNVAPNSDMVCKISFA